MSYGQFEWTWFQEVADTHYKGTALLGTAQLCHWQAFHTSTCKCKRWFPNDPLLLLKNPFVFSLSLSLSLYRHYLSLYQPSRLSSKAKGKKQRVGCDPFAQRKRGCCVKKIQNLVGSKLQQVCPFSISTFWVREGRRNTKNQEMGCSMRVCSVLFLTVLLVACARGEDPYRFYTWNVTYGDIYPLGVKQQGILINWQFPGPQIEAVTNDNLIINVFNSLDEPFLLSWNGVLQRRNSWQDGVYGTNCPIPPGQNFTYVLQVKDQIGSYFYYPSLAFHKAAGGYGGFKIASRPGIPVPFPPPAGEFTILAGDWYKRNHTDLRAILDGGSDLPFPDGLIINGRGSNAYTFTVDQGKTYRFRISNVGLTTSINFRIQGHKMTIVEVEGTHTLQNIYDSLDVHLGQTYSVLVTADQPPQDYLIVVTTRFTSQVLNATSIFRYSNSGGSVTGLFPWGPTIQVDWSLNQARSLRRNLTASGPRPNPQGSYHYGLINTTRTIRLQNSAPVINGKQRYAVNSVSFIPADTPLKLADYYKIQGVFSLGSISDNPTGGGGYLQTSVMEADFRGFLEVVFENTEDTVESWHIDGHSFFVVGMDGGLWSQASRLGYNLRDTVSRSTVQVYPKSWTALYMPLDNVGMWNVRSENWVHQYLGQQFYLRVYSPANSWRDEYPIPSNALRCGKAVGHY